MLIFTLADCRSNTWSGGWARGGSRCQEIASHRKSVYNNLNTDPFPFRSHKLMAYINAVLTACLTGYDELLTIGLCNNTLLVTFTPKTNIRPWVQWGTWKPLYQTKEGRGGREENHSHKIKERQQGKLWKVVWHYTTWVTIFQKKSSKKHPIKNSCSMHMHMLITLTSSAEQTWVTEFKCHCSAPAHVRWSYTNVVRHL